MITGFMIYFVLVSLLLVGLCVPIILRKVKPNSWYGFRVPKTLSDEKIWYEANAYSGRLMLVAGIIWAVAAVGLRCLPGVGTDLAVYNLSVTAVIMVSLSLVVALSFRYLRML